MPSDRDQQVLELAAEVKRSGRLPTARALAERDGIDMRQADALIRAVLESLRRG